MEVLGQLLGRLHPLVVHLPIGFVIVGLLLGWYDRNRRQLEKVIALIFLWAAITALFACITGYLQYRGEGYAFDTVKWHLWTGIATALFCFVGYLRVHGPLLKKGYGFLKTLPFYGFGLVIFALISTTGHLGGNITHGEGYLTEPLPDNVKQALGIETYGSRPITLEEESWQEALLYADVIDPILQNNCVSCHNPQRTKGDLQLQSPEKILAGGESGEVLTDDPEKSELYLRLTLPEEDEDHMPPKEKKQPSKEEIELIRAWIGIGHPFGMTIGESGLSKELFATFFVGDTATYYPQTTVAEADVDSIRAIKEFGVHIENISEVSPLLSASAINKPSFSDSDFEKLRSLAEQLAVVDLGGTQVTDSIFGKLATLPHLTRLVLDNTSIRGHGIDALKSLAHLKTLNLAGTQFEAGRLQVLMEFPVLEKVYLYRTPAAGESGSDQGDADGLFEFGGFDLPPIPSDSIVY